ncbi:hypothetical protein PHLGIDRAFT_420610 [Phlebiopsis gigantea 11061_1 CR5-6]|uniref:Uncharacterized protein n=1 Tax=Phlebiopsis gigantea (strain 11061_1 CR5-6) TaxID=745531 RepID=A0A0C3PLQ2_PHLG1|nr:hypothetical protein PHLGIDRAFT_420610 [Phlebiopsis gigantea 11061_1 CR5-6]
MAFVPCEQIRSIHSLVSSRSVRECSQTKIHGTVPEQHSLFSVKSIQNGLVSWSCSQWVVVLSPGACQRVQGRCFRLPLRNHDAMRTFQQKRDPTGPSVQPNPTPSREPRAICTRGSQTGAFNAGVRSVSSSPKNAQSRVSSLGLLPLGTVMRLSPTRSSFSGLAPRPISTSESMLQYFACRHSGKSSLQLTLWCSSATGPSD